MELPEVDNYMPTDNGESPIANIRDWVETTCPCCGGKAERETDTMPQWAGSSWYFLRYIDPHNDKALASRDTGFRLTGTMVEWSIQPFTFCIPVSGTSSCMIRV